MKKPRSESRPSELHQGTSPQAQCPCVHQVTADLRGTAGTTARVKDTAKNEHELCTLSTGISWTSSPKKSLQHAEAETIPLRSAELNMSRRKTAVNWIAKDKLDTLAKRKQSWQQQQMGRGGKENRNTARRREP